MRNTVGVLYTDAVTQFTVTPTPLLASALTFTVIDNGANDADPAIGVIKVANVKVGTTYTVTETVPPAGYALERNPPRTITVASSGTVYVSIDTTGVNEPGATGAFHDPLGS